MAALQSSITFWVKRGGLQFLYFQNFARVFENFAQEIRSLVR
jgi:hypothetical protein